jgi:hypothetical protein
LIIESGIAICTYHVQDFYPLLLFLKEVITYEIKKDALNKNLLIQGAFKQKIVDN